VQDSWVEAIRVNWQRYLRLQDQERRQKEEERRQKYRPCRQCDKDLNNRPSYMGPGREPLKVVLISVYSVDSSEFCSMSCSTSHEIQMGMIRMNEELRSKSHDEVRRVLEDIAQQQMAERAKARLAEWAKADAASAEPCVECHGRDGGCAFCT